MRALLAAALAAPLFLFSPVAHADGEVTKRTETDILNPSPEVAGLFTRMRPASVAAGPRLEINVVKPSQFNPALQAVQMSAPATNALIAELVKSYREVFGGEPVIPAPGS